MPEQSTQAQTSQVIEQHSRAQASARIRENWKKVSLAVYWVVIIGLMLLPIAWKWKIAIFFGQFPALFLYLSGVNRLRLRVYQIGHDGDTGRALDLNRRFSWLPGYGSSFEGILLFEAGRYREAVEVLKPLAFDALGKPRLGTVELYAYAVSLGNDGHEGEAQPFLEDSIPVAAKPDGFRVALATNLLDQDKNPERARELLEQAMSTPPRQSTAYGEVADRARRTARFAWALARCGQTKDASEQIQQALVESETLKPADLAGVHYFIGEAWRGMGQDGKARASFREVLRLTPEGVTAISARKGLAKIG